MQFRSPTGITTDTRGDGVGCIVRKGDENQVEVQASGRCVPGTTVD